MYQQLETPTERNGEIYHDIAAGMSQRQAADKYNLSQPMICKIVKQYKEWLIATAPDEQFSNVQADYLATNAWCETLTRGKELALEAYQQSCQPSQAPRDDGKPGRWYPSKPDMRCLKQLVECTEKFVVASKAREAARRLLEGAREQDPKYQAEQRRIKHENVQRRLAEQLRCDIGARENREVSQAEARAILARPDLGCQLTSKREGVPPVPADVRRLSEPDYGVVNAIPKTAPAVIKASESSKISTERAAAERLSPAGGQDGAKGSEPATKGVAPDPQAESNPAHFARLSAVRQAVAASRSASASAGAAR
jgi:hypothetical protein